MADITQLALGTRVRCSNTLHRTSSPSIEHTAGGYAVEKRWEPHHLELFRFQHPERSGEGIVVGIRTLSNGQASYYEDHTAFRASGTVTAVIIAHHLRRKPVYALPEHIEIITETQED